MAKYLYMVAAAAFCILASVCGGLYGANSKLKAEIRALDDALKTCMESGRALEDNRAALMAQLTEQEKACREQVKRTQQVYYSMVLDERQKSVRGVSPHAHPPLHKAGEPQTPPPHNKNTEVQDKLRPLPEGGTAGRSAIIYQVVSYEKSTDAINLLNNAFRVFRGGSLQNP